MASDTNLNKVKIWLFDAVYMCELKNNQKDEYCTRVVHNIKNLKSNDKKKTKKQKKPKQWSLEMWVSDSSHLKYIEAVTMLWISSAKYWEPYLFDYLTY